MGSLVLCHERHATHPYEITRIHCKIFTIEELCYYLCNNLYLIDYTIMNEQLCVWLDEELGMPRLAGQLRDVIRLRGSIEKFVLTILKDSKIYREPEMIRIQNVLERLRNQKDIERQKYKGDNLLESGEIEEEGSTPDWVRLMAGCFCIRNLQGCMTGHTRSARIPGC